MGIRGSCLCGAVTFVIEPPFQAFQYCHCSRCRKRSGSAHAANVFVLPNQFQWLRGEAEVKRFDLPGAKAWSCAFCTTCGSAVPWLGRSGQRVIVPAGALDDPPPTGPTRNIYFGSRAPWYAHASELEVHDDAPT